MTSLFHSLNIKTIIHILDLLFTDATEEETQLYEYNIVNSGIFSFVNAAIESPTIGNRIFELLNTTEWLKILITMDIFECPFRKRFQWSDSIKEYHGRIIKELRYTSRVHDLIDISKSENIPLYIRDLARCLLYNLINEHSTELDYEFLLGTMTNIPILTDNTIHAYVSTRIAGNREFDNVKYWDIRNVTSLESLFSRCNVPLTKVLDLTYWDTRNITNMNGLFYKPFKLEDNESEYEDNESEYEDNESEYEDNESEYEDSDSDVLLNTGEIRNIIGITNWNTSKVIDMSYLFSGVATFNQPLRWNTSKVEYISGIFSHATSFNQPLDWDTSNVNYMSYMFKGATSFNQPLHWNTSNVSEMIGTFEGATSFNQELKWDTSNVINMSRMFKGARSFNQPLDWIVSNVDNMDEMFCYAILFDQELKWDTSNVKNMNYMFKGARSFNQELKWDTSNVLNMYKMFEGARSFNQPLDWNTSKVQCMDEMFKEAISFNQALKWNRDSLLSSDNIFQNSRGRWTRT